MNHKENLKNTKTITTKFFPIIGISKKTITSLKDVEYFLTAINKNIKYIKIYKYCKHLKR